MNRIIFSLFLLVAMFGTVATAGDLRPSRQGDHPVERFVNRQEADPMICTTYPTRRWASSDYAWTFTNKTFAPTSLFYGDGSGIKVASRGRDGVGQSQVGALRAGGVTYDVTILLPGQTCFGVWPVEEALVAADVGIYLRVVAKRAVRRSTGVLLDAGGITLSTQSLYSGRTAKKLAKMSASPTCGRKPLCWEFTLVEHNYR